MFAIKVRDTDETIDTAESWFTAADVMTYLQKSWKTALIIEKVTNSS